MQLKYRKITDANVCHKIEQRPQSTHVTWGTKRICFPELQQGLKWEASSVKAPLEPTQDRRVLEATAPKVNLSSTIMLWFRDSYRTYRHLGPNSWSNTTNTKIFKITFCSKGIFSFCKLMNSLWEVRLFLSLLTLNLFLPVHLKSCGINKHVVNIVLVHSWSSGVLQPDHLCDISSYITLYFLLECHLRSVEEILHNFSSSKFTEF